MRVMAASPSPTNAAPRPEAETLRITEVFHSLQGETRRVGLPTVFVRLTGCPLRCHYCDTAYAFHGGRRLSLEEVMNAVGRHATRYVTVTGGEPLAQPACFTLLTLLCDAGYQVSLETGGAIDLSAVDRRVMKVMDLKTPGSGEAHRNRYDNLRYLGAEDEIKFVICDRADYEWARARLPGLPCEALFSPSHGQMDPAVLAEWVLEDRLPVRFQLQLHKVLWGDARGR
jgi:7-carboxy-7-deazaguanine synthase